MRIFKTKWMASFTRREGIADKRLREAIKRAEQGLIDADRGGCLIKQRVARPGEGRSGGYRMIVVYRTGDRAVFIFGFSKSEQENIGSSELSTMREIATMWLSANAERIALGIAADELKEIPL